MVSETRTAAVGALADIDSMRRRWLPLPLTGSERGVGGVVPEQQAVNGVVVFCHDPQHCKALQVQHSLQVGCRDVRMKCCSCCSAAGTKQRLHPKGRRQPPRQAASLKRRGQKRAPAEGSGCLVAGP